jgi:hypothetical protein
VDYENTSSGAPMNLPHKLLSGGRTFFFFKKKKFHPTPSLQLFIIIGSAATREKPRGGREISHPSFHLHFAGHRHRHRGTGKSC